LNEHIAVTPEQLYEQTLVLRSQIGDEAAFSELVALHGPALLRFTERMLQSSSSDVADLFQEIWISIFRGLPSLSNAAKFRAWAFRIARDRIYREYRRRRLVVRSFEDGIVEADALITAEGESAIDREELEGCLKILSAEQREVLVLRYFEEMTYEEIARVAGVTVGTVRSRLHYGKLALRTVWEEKKL